MKFLVVFIVTCLAVSTLGLKTPPRRSGPPPPRGPPPRPRGPPLPPKKRDDHNKGLGWGSSSGWSSGWSGPPSYDTLACVNPDIITQANWDPDFFGRIRLWYMTGDTKYGYILLARILLGRYPLNQDELNYMCPAQVFSSSTTTQYTFGYGVEFQQECTGDIQGSCPISTDPSTYDGALGVDPFAGFVTQVSNVVATDNTTYVIYLVCNDGTFGDIQLLTTRPYASPDAVAAFVAAAQQYNIPLSQLQLALCLSPYTGPYPSPFQNYPNGNGWSSNSTGWSSAPSNGWSSGPVPTGWSDPQPSGWNSPADPQPAGWNASNGWGSGPQPAGWSGPNGWGSGPQPVGWSNNNNGWSNNSNGWSSGHILDVKTDVIEEESKKQEEKLGDDKLCKKCG